MTLRTFIRRSLRYHRRTHAGVVVGAAIGSAALVGALVVGDSVDGTLRERALKRLGTTVAALHAQDRTVRQALVEAIAASVPEGGAQRIRFAPALLRQGTVALGDASARANRVTVFGIDPDSWTALGGNGARATPLGDQEVLLNANLAAQLGAEPGAILLVRVPKPSALPQEAVIASRDEATVGLRLRFAGILDEDHLGDFSLHANATGPRNAFVSLATLQAATGVSGRVNLVLAGNAGQTSSPPGADAAGDRVLQEALQEHWRLADAECMLAPVPGEMWELRTSRVFLDPSVERAALDVGPDARPVLTYIANLIERGTNAAPYSMVTAAGAPWTPADLREDEILLNQWLADDLGATPGDSVGLVYYDPESGARLVERTNFFRVRSIVPMEMPWADRSLMPPFPGIERAERTADWDTAFPLVYTVREKDDDYWQTHRGTPKAFVSLAAGKRMWSNRFGDVTAIRFAADAGSPEDAVRRRLESGMLGAVDPAALGLRFEPVREQALAAARGAQDFGGLFIGFSLFLIAAALILMALLFRFGLEQRAAEVGTLLALGFTRRQVRRLLLIEGAALAFIGGGIGVLGGLGYAWAMLMGLGTIWRDAVAGAGLEFHVTVGSLLIGLMASTAVAVGSLWLALRGHTRRPAVDLLSARIGDSGGRRAAGGKVGRWEARAGVGASVATLGLVGWALARGETANAGVFFGAGSLILAAGLSLTAAWLARLTHAATSPGRRRESLSLVSLAWRGTARRRSRSVSTAALLACGAFVVLSIGVFRLDARHDAGRRSSGTGGFTLIGETMTPIVHDLNTEEGRAFFALDDGTLDGVTFTSFRVRQGDEASCLNLTRAQKPRLLGVDPAVLNERFTFAKVAPGFDRTDGWSIMNAEPGTGSAERDVVPAIGDLNSILWAMGKKVGDTLDYVDGRGRPFKVRLVGAVANSILQGNLIIPEDDFVERFPDASGYQYLLMDVPTNRVETVSAALSRALQDYGLEVTSAARRLNEFNAVQNTYLGTFQILGGLGLLLGSAGLGIVVLRNTLERRGELAVLLATGFRKRRIQRLVFLEHAGLLGLGLAMGLGAAAVAVLPTLISPGSQLPYASLVPTLLVVLLNGMLWTWLATRVALRGNLLEALRNE